MPILNLVLSFLLELCMLAAFGYWGFTLSQPVWLKFVLGLGVPVLAIAGWGQLLAPKSERRLPQPWLLLAKAVMFGLAVLALYNAGQPNLAIVFGILVALNLTLGQVWKQE